MMLMDDQASAMTMGVPPMINGSVAGADQGRETFEIRMAQGRDLTVEDEGAYVATLGSDIARKYDKQVGRHDHAQGRRHSRSSASSSRR